MTKWVFIGDSHMQGLAPRLRRLIPSKNLLRVEARPGWSAHRYVGSGIVPSLARGADVVVFELGGNDAAAGIEPSQHVKDVRQLVMQAQPAKIVWVGPGVTERADLERRRALLKPVQKKLMNAAEGFWVDGHKLTERRYLRGDGIHYTPEGYDAYARALVNKLSGLGSRPSWVLPVGIAAAIGGGIFVVRSLQLRQV